MYIFLFRFLGKDIITIREAAWLTDNTYKYEDVVRMMGEITATLKGSIRVSDKLLSCMESVLQRRRGNRDNLGIIFPIFPLKHNLLRQF